MSLDSQKPLLPNGHGSNGHAPNGRVVNPPGVPKAWDTWDKDFKSNVGKPGDEEFHGDKLRADKETPMTGTWTDIKDVFTLKNASKIATVAWHKITTGGLDMVAGAQLVGSLPTTSKNRAAFLESGVVDKYQKMLHPPLTYLGDAFQYRSVDGKFNNVLSPHLGQAGAPYAKTVPSKTPVLGALPDPGDIFDRLMAREGDPAERNVRKSESGLSSMLLYHATIIIHDIFRTNDKDKNISDSSSYLDLSPLYGYTKEMQRKVRDDKYKLGLLKPDTFAEDRLLRQPPGVCIMLVMYNRYHNYAATQLRLINENGKFSVPLAYREEDKLVAIARKFAPEDESGDKFRSWLEEYKRYWTKHEEENEEVPKSYYEKELLKKIEVLNIDSKARAEYEAAYDAAWTKLDDDLFNTARLITCGMYVNISIHDYLRALMGFHQYDSTFTLDPRIAINKNGQRDAISRGIGNQVTSEFNLLYRFHCAISGRDEQYTREYIMDTFGPYFKKIKSDWQPEDLTMTDYMAMVAKMPKLEHEPSEITFGLPKGDKSFTRNVYSNLFDDQQMINELLEAMDEPIGNFGALNVPKCLKAIECMGIIQARKWEVGTLNDFRDFFGMPRHKDFNSITKSPDVQNALRDLYDHPDKVELYPGIFCEGDESKNLDPGPNETTYALWAAIFSDAITLVRSDRFYTVDWNTNSLTSWGMKEVTPDMNVLKSSVFHRLLQRAFPQWFPYNSLRFFHPFYTNATNKKFAQEQGYWKDLRDEKPSKPTKPIYLASYKTVNHVLLNEDNLTCSLASYDHAWMPKPISAIFDPALKKPANADILKADPAMVSAYFSKLTRDILQREAYRTDKHTFQIDIVRDVAIPVFIKYMADLLGFSRRIKSPQNPNAEFSEEEIFQHIANCQVKNSWMSDETKIIERRVAAQNSMQFLLDLAKAGHVREASQFSFSWFRNTSQPKTISEFGMAVARQTLKHLNNNSEKTAAVLLMGALDNVYNSVLAFSSTLEGFMHELYKNPKSCSWVELQRYAAEDENEEHMREMILKTQALNLKTLAIRRVTTSGTITDDEGVRRPVEKGAVVICDVSRACKGESIDNITTILSYGLNDLSQGLSYFDTHEMSVNALTTVFKVVARMRNLRRGHDAQGHVKSIRLEGTTEGYENYVAPGRMHEIYHNVLNASESIQKVTKDLTEKRAEKEKAINDTDKDAAQREIDGLEAKLKKLEKDKDALSSILEKRILQPTTTTFLTPEWNEMIPYPSTWKVRFEGFGISDYNESFKLVKPQPPDDKPPFYQPRGLSHYGGTFADALPESLEELPAAKVATIAGGCGVMGQ